jgi:hypothetical protein
VGVLLKDKSHDEVRAWYGKLLPNLTTEIKKADPRQPAPTFSSEFFVDVESARTALRERRIGLLGELSPRQVDDAFRDLAAVPIISPIYGGSGLYESVFVVANKWLREMDGSASRKVTNDRCLETRMVPAPPQARARSPAVDERAGLPRTAPVPRRTGVRAGAADPIAAGSLARPARIVNDCASASGAWDDQS